MHKLLWSNTFVCAATREMLLLPEELLAISEEGLNEISGFELHFRQPNEGFKVGQNRFAEGESMFGEMRVYGNPIRQPKQF